MGITRADNGQWKGLAVMQGLTCDNALDRRHACVALCFPADAHRSTDDKVMTPYT